MTEFLTQFAQTPVVILASSKVPEDVIQFGLVRPVKPRKVKSALDQMDGAAILEHASCSRIVMVTESQILSAVIKAEISECSKAPKDAEMVGQMTFAANKSTF